MSNPTTQTSSDSKEVPKTKLALEEKYKEQDKIEQSKRVDETNVDSVIDELPEPSGWRLLVLPFTPKDKAEGINFGIKSLSAVAFLKTNNIDPETSIMTFGMNNKKLLQLLEESTVYTYCN